MARYATGLWVEMMDEVHRCKRARVAEDSCSPMREATLEAEPGRSFRLEDVRANLPAQRRVNTAWAVANVLHFFAATEEAEPLRRCNPHAERFLTGNRWVGAYGAAARPQLDRCVELLRKHPSTRRAVVCMPGLGEEQDVNRPACWCSLHLLDAGGQLDLLVYQRSLNVYGVMAYDCSLLCNILMFVAEEVGAPVGCLRWTVGSLHTVPGSRASEGRYGTPDGGVRVPNSVLRDPAACWTELVSGANFEGWIHV